MQVIITGSSGTLGFETLSALSADPALEISGVSRRPLPFGAGLPNRITPDPLGDDWLRELSASSTIVHFAGLSNPRVPFADTGALWQEAIAPQARFAERLIATGWRGHLIYLSTGGALYGDAPLLPVAETHPTAPKTAYALQKLTVETILSHLALHHGFRLTILRLANPYGARLQTHGRGVVSMLIDAARSGSSFTIQNGGKTLRDFLHVDDMVSAIRSALNTNPEPSVRTLHIGSGTGTSILELIGQIEAATGCRILTEDKTAPMVVGDIVLDISQARRALDWAPSISLQEGLRRTVAGYPT